MISPIESRSSLTRQGKLHAAYATSPAETPALHPEEAGYHRRDGELEARLSEER